MGNVHSNVPKFLHRASELGPSLTNESGHILKSRHIPVSNPKALLFSFPGMGSHSWCPNDFDPLIARCQSRGLSLYSLDHAGHGYSEGPRNLIVGTAPFDDGLKFVQSTLEKQDDIPFFLMGFSLGGLTALKVGLELQERGMKQFQGVIVLAPAIKESISPSWFVRELIRYTLLPFFPKMTIPGVCNLDPSKCYRDPEALRIVSEDRLRYRDSPGLPIGNISLLDAMADFQSDIADIRFPLMVIHGDKDIVTPLSGSEFLIANAGSKEKVLHVYEDVPHCIIADPDFQLIWDDIVCWMEHNLGCQLNRDLHG